MSLNLDKSNWTAVTFGDVVKNLNVTVKDPESEGIDRVIAMEHLDPGELHIVRWGSIEDSTTFTRRVKPGQTLFGKRRAYQRKAAYAEFDAITSGDILVFEANPNLLLPEFLPFVVQSDAFYDHALRTSAGSLSPRTNWGDLSTYRVALPSLDEQRRLADLLWSLERHRRHLREVGQALLETHRRARLALLLFGPRTGWVEQPISPDPTSDWTVSIPDGWTRETIGTVARVRSGATPNRSQQARFFDGGTTPWVKTLDLNEGVLDRTDEMITDEALAETSAKLMPEGTVLVAMYGGFGQIGRTARLGVAAASNQAVSGLLDLREDVDPRFVHEVLMAGRSKWRRVAASTRKDPNITKKDIERFDFPLPPIAEQRQIVEALDSVWAAHVAATDELAACDQLARSLSTAIFGSN